MARKRCYYDVLQVSRSASQEQIAEAYRKLAKQYHPDWHPHDRAANDKFKEVTRAYDVLSDSKKRAKYDEKLERRARAANNPPGPPPVQEESTNQAHAPRAEPHSQAEPPPEEQSKKEAASGYGRFSFILMICVLSMLAISVGYFVITYETPDSQVRSLLARAEVKIQLGDLDEATQLVRKATNIEGANNLSAAKKLLDAIAAEQDAEAEQKAQSVAERKAKEEAQRRDKIEAKRKAEEAAKMPLIVGVWQHAGSGLWLVRPDGTAYNDHYVAIGRSNGEGTWKAAGKNGYDFEFRWNNGEIDHVKINKDGKTFEGFCPGNNARWRMVRAAYPSHQFIIPAKNTHTESHVEKRLEKSKTVIPKPSRPEPKLEEPIKKLSFKHAKRVLGDADLWEGKPGVWYLKQANNFAARTYERLSNSRKIRSALRAVNGRLPTKAEMNNAPSRR